MAFILFRNNPRGRNVGDCVIRALSKALDISWQTAYIDMVMHGYYMGDMPSSNAVLNAYLHTKGFRRYVISNECEDCYSIRQFSIDNPQGTYIVCTGTHTVAIIDGNYYDSWDPGDEVPLFYWKKEYDVW